MRNMGHICGMRLLFLILVFLIAWPTFSQFAIIKDTDGYVNVRDSSSKAARVFDTLPNGHCVYVLAEENEAWVGIDYEKNGRKQYGYVHRSRLQFINQFKNTTASKALPTSVFFKWDQSSLSISKIPFDYKKHALQYAKNDSLNPTGQFLIGIDGHALWGTDGELPHYQYGRMALTINGKPIELPIKGLYNPNLDFTEVNLDVDNNTLYIHTLNSDGAGGYAVIWIVKNGVCVKQWVTIPF
jgi:hypothetical protein